MTVHELRGHSLYEQWILNGHSPSEMPELWHSPANFWAVNSRPAQRLYWEEDWIVRLLLSGKGAGKSFAMAEMAMDCIEQYGVQSIAAVGRTFDEVRNILTEQALLPAAERRFGIENVELKIGNKQLHIFGGTRNGGSTIQLMSAEKPESFRGYNFEMALCDEWCFWKDIEADENAWANLKTAVRRGAARFIIATTPIGRPFVRELRDDPDTYATATSSFENRAYLDENFFVNAMKLKRVNPLRYRQEVLGEIIDEVQDALWTGDMIKAASWPADKDTPKLQRVIVSIDPAGSAGDQSDHTGIVVAGRSIDQHGYILHSERVKMSPDNWARRAMELVMRYGARKILVEGSGAGKDSLTYVLKHTAKDMKVAVSIDNRTPSGEGSKWERASPVGLLYDPEEPRIHHVGSHPELETEMRFFTLESSRNKEGDDLVDALVWSCIGLGLVRSKKPIEWAVL